MTLGLKPYWHDVNPWADSVVYVPIERLAECVAGGTISNFKTGKVVPYDAAYVLKHFAQGGNRLDAYILPQPDGRHSLGVRYGAEGSQYFSPHNAHPARTQALLEEFSMNAYDDAAKRAAARELQPLVDAITDAIFLFNEVDKLSAPTKDQRFLAAQYRAMAKQLDRLLRLSPLRHLIPDKSAD